MRPWYILFSLAVATCFAASAGASTYLDLDDDAYSLLSRLEAEGVVRSALLSTRPISRAEAIRLLHEAETNAEGRGEFIKALVRELEQRIGPEAGGLRLMDSAYAKYINTNADVRTLQYYSTHEQEQALNADNNGDKYDRGSNGRVGFTSRADDIGGFSLFLNPEFKTAQCDAHELIMKRGYVVFDFGWDLIAGRDSQWWGPGQHGAILLSNNAEPLTMVKIANPNPVILPWVLKYLGPFDFTCFATQLERDRADLAAPYLWGMRMNFKPHPNLEIGLERTATLGGRGRSTDVNTWLHSVLGTHEHQSGGPGDQRAGYDLKLTLPFELQPLQVYWEEDGEENRQGANGLGLPYKLADLYGIYLPRVLSFERISLRAEYASNLVKQQPYVWYVHLAGYTYHGMVIGHHMGTDSRDVFMEFTVRAPEQHARMSISYDVMTHNLSFDVNETAHELSVRTVVNLSTNTDLDLTYGYGWIANVENVSGAAWKGYSFQGTITRRF